MLKMATIENNDEIFYGGDLQITPCKQNIGQYFLNIMAKNPNKIGQIDPINKVTQTYGELRKSSVRCALKMKAKDVKRGDVVMICGRIHMDLIIPFFATMYTGATILPLHPDYSRNEILRMIKITEPKMIFCDKECTDLMIELTNELNLHTEIVSFETDFKSYLTPHGVIDEENFVAETVDVLNDNVLIVCTSGTTGFIKGVTMTHNTYYTSIILHRIVKETDGALLYYSPLSWISANISNGQMLWYGVSKITCEYDPKTNLEIMAAYNIKWFFMTSLKVQEMIRHPLFEQYSSKIIKNLKFLMLGGTPSTLEQLKEYRKVFKNAFVYNAYGSTEMGIFPSFFDRIKDKTLNDTKIISSGRPMVGTYWKFIHPDTEKPVGRNQKGELLVKGPLLTKGYYKDPEATAMAIDEDGWFHTGDLVMVDDDNCLFVVGRLKELLKYKGWQVSPTELENILETHSSIETACVMSRPHEIYGDLPLAFVVKKTTATDVTDDEIINFVNNQVADSHKLRGGVIFLDKLPRTANGKIRKQELKKLII